MRQPRTVTGNSDLGTKVLAIQNDLSDQGKPGSLGDEKERPTKESELNNKSTQVNIRAGRDLEGRLEKITYLITAPKSFLHAEPKPSETRLRWRYSTMATAHQLSLPEAVIHQRNRPRQTEQVDNAASSVFVLITGVDAPRWDVARRPMRRAGSGAGARTGRPRPAGPALLRLGCLGRW
jgi:hypothetical protein